MNEEEEKLQPTHHIAQEQAHCRIVEEETTQQARQQAVEWRSQEEVVVSRERETSARLQRNQNLGLACLGGG